MADNSNEEKSVAKSPERVERWLAVVLRDLNRRLVEYQGVVALACFTLATVIALAAWLWPRG